MSLLRLVVLTNSLGEVSDIDGVRRGQLVSDDLNTLLRYSVLFRRLFELLIGAVLYLCGRLLRFGIQGLHHTCPILFDLLKLIAVKCYFSVFSLMEIIILNRHKSSLRSCSY